jgi:uncharacterized protein involved in exopolysaccharide biosynthesis
VRALFQWRYSALVFFICFFSFLMTLAYVLPESFTAKANVFVKAGRQNAPEGTSTTISESARLTLSPEDVVSETMIMLSRPALEYAVNILETEVIPQPKDGFSKKYLNFQNWCRSIGLSPGPLFTNGVVPSKFGDVVYTEEKLQYDSKWWRDWLLQRNLPEDKVRILIADLEGKPSKASSDEIDNLKLQVKNLLDKERLYRHEQMVAKLGKKISAEIEPATRVINLSYELASPRIAARTLELVLEGYMEHHSKMHSLGTWREVKVIDINGKEVTKRKYETTAASFFREQANLNKAELEKIQEQITEFRLSHKGGDLDSQRTILTQELIQTEQSLRALKEINQGSEELALDSPEISVHQQRLLDLELELIEKAPLYEGTDNPTIKSLHNKIQLTKDALQRQIIQKRAVLEDRAKSLDQELRNIEANRTALEDLLQKRDSSLGSYKKFIAKAEEEDIKLAMDSDHVTSAKVLEWPTVPNKPSFPNRFIMALLGIFLGIPGALAVALLRAYMHSRIATVEDVEEVLGVSVLSSIPRFARIPFRTPFKDGMPPVVLNAARLALAALDNDGHRSVHVAASTRGEGSGTLAAALSLEASNDGRSVVFATLGGFPAILGEAENVEILQLDGAPMDAQKEAIQAAAEENDLLVLSGPGLAGGGGSYASLTDTSLFVVSGTGVHFDVARRGLDQLRRYGKAVLGAVLTQRRNPIPRILYRFI